jgi:hypothetical protein
MILLWQCRAATTLRRLQGKFDPGKVELVVQPREHGFDVEAGLEAPSLKQGLEKVTKLWLG